MKIGLVPMAAKPYHAGHDMLVRVAASENDQVKLYVSTSDRREEGVGISGDTMLYIWLTYIQDTLPKNVVPDYDITSPVAKVYNELEKAEEQGSEDVYTIYSDDKDIVQNYDEKSLMDSAPGLFTNGQIIPKGVSRQETIDISGTQMRDFLEDAPEEGEDDIEEEDDNKQLFISYLPSSIQQHGDEIFDMLKNDIVGESLVRKYVRNLLLLKN